MNPALKQIKNHTRSLWRDGKLSALSNRELLAEARKISQTAQYSPEAMRELDEALAAPLTFESLKNTTVIKDTFALAGIADEQAQKRFLEDGLIYNGMFRVLCDGGKDIEKEVLNHPQRRGTGPPYHAGMGDGRRTAKRISQPQPANGKQQRRGKETTSAARTKIHQRRRRHTQKTISRPFPSGTAISTDTPLHRLQFRTDIRRRITVQTKSPTLL